MTKEFQIKLLTKDLIHTLNLAGGIVDKRPVKPILGNVKLEVEDNELIITATSSDLSIKLTIQGQVTSQGSTTVNIVTFLEVVRKISDQTIDIIYNNETEQLSIKGENFVSKLATLPAEEFPALDNQISDHGAFFVKSKQLLRLITHSEFAISPEETRYNMNGIFLNSYDNAHLNSTAVDGHRMASVSERLEKISDFGMIIPRKTVFELLKIFKDSQYSEMETWVTFDQNRISFMVGNLQIISKLIDAEFPDYKVLLPETSKNKLSIHSKYLFNVVDRVASINHEKFRAIKFMLSKDEIEISAFGETKGSAKESISNAGPEPKFLYEGEQLAIGFNPTYLLDILKNLDDTEIEFHFNDSLDAILVKQAGYEEDKYIIMPMKV